MPGLAADQATLSRSQKVMRCWTGALRESGMNPDLSVSPQIGHFPPFGFPIGRRNHDAGLAVFLLFRSGTDCFKVKERKVAEYSLVVLHNYSTRVGKILFPSPDI